MHAIEARGAAAGFEKRFAERIARLTDLDDDTLLSVSRAPQLYHGSPCAFDLFRSHHLGCDLTGGTLDYVVAIQNTRSSIDVQVAYENHLQRFDLLELGIAILTGQTFRSPTPSSWICPGTSRHRPGDLPRRG